MTRIGARSGAAIALFALLSLQATATSDSSAPPAGELQSLVLEFDTDRPGRDYYSFDLREPNADTCRAACERDNRCRAFTFVKPGVHGRYARCYLKNAVPAKRADRCCVSGARR